MKRTLLFVLFLAVALGVSVSAFADAYTIGTGTSTESYIPFYGLYDYGWSKTIHTSTEMIAAGMPAAGTTITGVSYYVGNTPSNYVAVDQRVYVRGTTATAIDLTYIADPLAEAVPFTAAYIGDLTWNGGGWHNITFTTPFVWNGTDNVEIYWQNWDGDYASGPNFRYTSTTPTYLACYRYADTAMPTTNGTNYYNRPNIRFLDALVSPPGPPSLLLPADLAINVSQSPTFSWSAPTTGGIPTGYKLYLNEGSATFAAPLYEGPNTSFPYPGVLNYSAVYYWKVAATNTAADSDSPVWSFTVRDDPTVTPEYCVDFGTASIDWPVLNWTQLNGLYGGTLVSGSQWYQDDWLNVLDPVNKAAKINIYGSSRYGWLITPPVNIPADGSFEIKFDACLVDWNNSTPPEATQPDDRLLVVMGDTPMMANPVILAEFNNTGSPLVFDGIPAEGATYHVAIPATGIKYFAFYGESTLSNGDNDLMIDNFCIQTAITVPVELSSFTATVTAENNVKLTWTSQSESQMMGYLVYRNTSPDQSSSELIGTSLIPATNTSSTQTYTATDNAVEVGSTYYYWLEAVDYNSSAYHGPVSVTVEGNVPSLLPQVTTLKNIYPNPFKGSANIVAEVKAGETGTVTVYNITGQVVKTYEVGEGFNNLTWDGRDARGASCSSGIYFLRLSTPSHNQTRKLVLAK